jgi:hypothetical protein
LGLYRLRLYVFALLSFREGAFRAREENQKCRIDEKEGIVGTDSLSRHWGLRVLEILRYEISDRVTLTLVRFQGC